LAVIAFAVTLAIIIGRRMSTEAMAVVVGVACGVLASIPASLLIVAVARRGGQQDQWQQTRPRAASPPVVVIQGGQPQRWETPQLPASTRYQNSPRAFEVVGQEGGEVWP
jgi:hypothetical protein